jgi:CBS-domain-containing membrane protein
VSEAVRRGAQPEPESRTIHPGLLPSRTGTPHRTTVGELMRQPVVAVEPGVGFAVAVAAMREHHHDVLPVLNGARQVMGMVCASDLLAKLAVQALPPRSLPWESPTVRAVRRRASALEMGDLMTSPAVTVTTGTTVAEAALIAIRHRVHHLPVVDEEGRLTGMVCLCDLLDVERRGDYAILAEARAVALAPDSGVVAATLDISCERGRVVLDARTHTRSQAERLRERIRAVEGVVDVREQLRWDADDAQPGR